MARKNKKLDAAVKVTQASKFFSFTDGELDNAQALIAKDEEKKKKALEKEEKQKKSISKSILMAEEEHKRFVELANAGHKKFKEELTKKEEEDLDKLFGEK
jgi:hypothetical protein